VVLALTAISLCGTSVAAGEVAAQLTASLSRQELTIGATLSVTGRLASSGQGLAGVPLALQADVYPFHGFVPIAHATSAPDGSFSFELRPDRNTRLRVVSEGAAPTTGPVLSAYVDARIAGSAHILGAGRVRLTLRVRHAPGAGERPVSVWWFLAARGSRVFRLAAVTATRERSPGVTYASVIIDPPAKRFVYRVCLNPPWEKAMGAASTHRRCPEATFVLSRDAR
jgi:hypothetical protein